MTRIRYVLRAAIGMALLAGAGSALHAQATPEKKPSATDKASKDVGSAVKKAEKDTKAEVKRDTDKSKKALTKAQKDAKAQAKRAKHPKAKTQPTSTVKPDRQDAMAVPGDGSLPRR